MFIRIFPMVILILAAMTASAIAEPYYARGSFYAGDGEAWNCDPGNKLFDDGLHGDGAAGDGVFGAFVTADQNPGQHGWKIATEDWTENYPNHPIYPTGNAILFLINPGEVIHFRLDTNTVGDGWQPATNAVSCSHYSLPLPGFNFEVIGSAPELGQWLSGTPVAMGPDLWFVYVKISEPGMHEFKFRVIGTWDICNLGIHYNMYRGDNFTFETTQPQTTVRFEFNPVNGQARAIAEEPLGIDELSWGHLKSLYR